MIYEGFFVEDIMMYEDARPHSVQPQSMSGLHLGTDSVSRFSLKSSDYPLLVIDEPIFDETGEVLVPGHYELALSDDRKYLLILETKQLRAVIPVMKIEEDTTEDERLNDKKYRKQLKKEAEERKKTNAKRLKAGMPPDEPKVYMKASIEYIKEGGYYLVRYERATIKAWAAFKG